MLSQTAHRAIKAYGGAEIWQRARRIKAVVNTSGLAFTLKRRPFFHNAYLELEIAHPFARLTPIGRDDGITGVLDGSDVWLQNTRGDIVADRKNARQHFRGGRKLLQWDDLDMAYFANYAFWNYFTLPRLLLNDSIHWTEEKEGVLHAIFPPDIPTHCQRQQFHFDTETGQLKRHYYTADIISRFARAVNRVTEHRVAKGYSYPSKRVVKPRGFGKSALPRPTLIDIEVLDFEFVL
jgi:hypothetical protein